VNVVVVVIMSCFQTSRFGLEMNEPSWLSGAARRARTLVTGCTPHLLPLLRDTTDGAGVQYGGFLAVMCIGLFSPCEFRALTCGDARGDSLYLNAVV
jgi:hypothetical protein